MSFLSFVFGNKDKKALKSAEKIVAIINNLEREFEVLSDEELKSKTNIFKTSLSEGNSLKNILPEAFAAVREASKRSIGLRHYDCQLLGGIILNEGKIAEMATGEGKTLVATLPCYLNALTEKSTLVITANEYLAKRDALWMSPIYEKLDMTVGYVTSDLDQISRKDAYSNDVVYVTNNEIGFDYLRDNMILKKEHQVMRDPYFAVVDEVDSILIDEARTPLIISGQVERPTEKYVQASEIANQVGAKAILAFTASGYNAQKISSNRPNAYICVFTHNRQLLNTLSLMWGVLGFYYNNFDSTDNTIEETQAILKESKIITRGDFVINIASMPIKEKGMTNMLKLGKIS